MTGYASYCMACANDASMAYAKTSKGRGATLAIRKKYREKNKKRIPGYAREYAASIKGQEAALRARAKRTLAKWTVKEGGYASQEIPEEFIRLRMATIRVKRKIKAIRKEEETRDKCEEIIKRERHTPLDEVDYNMAKITLITLGGNNGGEETGQRYSEGKSIDC